MWASQVIIQRFYIQRSGNALLYSLESHGGSVRTTVASQQEGCGFKSRMVIGYSFSRHFYPKRLTSSAYNRDIGTILLIS